VTRRILILIKGLGRGGAEQILASAAPHLDTARFEYRAAYLLPWKDSLVKDLEEAGVRTVCLGNPPRVAWPARLRRLITQERIDLVHAHSPVPASVARLLLPRRGVKMVYTEHNVWERYHPLTRSANALTFPLNDHVFAVSDHVRDSVRYPSALARLRMPVVETLYHGIDPNSVDVWTTRNGVREELGIKEGAPVVGTVANFKPHKRLDILLRAAGVVRRNIPDVRFVFVGKGPTETEVHQMARSLHLDETVVFSGFREDAPRVVTSFDVFVLSSEFEGLSIAAVEALALGKPVVVTSVGGLPEVVRDDVEGFVVPPGDHRALAERIIQLLRDPMLRARMGAAGCIRAEAFDIRRSVSRMESVYEELLT
jgi:glycosyltransferase involved in cell wall biosynthesis